MINFIERLVSLGLKIEYNKTFGENLLIEDLNEFKYIVLALGTTKYVKVLPKDEHVKSAFDILYSYSYTYSNDDSDLFYSDVIDEYNYDDITLDYMFDTIPKVIRILDKEYRLHIKFTIFNTWRAKYVDYDEIDSCFEEEDKDLLVLLKKIEKNIYKN
jgi:hypothetical protein